jgi:hypothetical protein
MADESAGHKKAKSREEALQASDSKDEGGKQRRRRVQRSFPASSFEEALEIPTAIQTHAAGQRIRRLTLFDHLSKSPDSGTSRQLVTNAARYGLIKGNYSSEYLELTDDGGKATDAETSPRERARVWFQLAIENIPPFNQLYEQNKNNRLPSNVVLHDFLREKGYSDAQIPECVDTFIVNAKYVGILRPVAGAERLLPIEQILEEMPATGARVAPIGRPAPVSTTAATQSATPPVTAAATDGDWDKLCFYITPIGEDESIERKHSDLFLHSIVEPALEEFELRVVRADQIGKPGMITAQVIEHIIKSRLVIADLSFHNPNVFYELALRHTCRLPTVQIIRSTDRIPFDLNQFRTVRIDDSSIYTLVPQLPVYQSEISTQVRRALANAEAADNPIAAFYPGLSVSFK